MLSHRQRREATPWHFEIVRKRPGQQLFGALFEEVTWEASDHNMSEDNDETLSWDSLLSSWI